MIRYLDGYKYQLAKDYQVEIAIKLRVFILTEYVRLDTDGMLTICEGYAWGSAPPVLR